jgi:hypothetical protein
MRVKIKYRKEYAIEIINKQGLCRKCRKVTETSPVIIWGLDASQKIK